MKAQVGQHIQGKYSGQIYQVREVRIKKGELMYRTGKYCWVFAKDFERYGKRNGY